MSYWGRVERFGISVVGRAGFVDTDRLAISPRSACKLDSDKFLEFADAVAKEAERERGRRAQLSMVDILAKEVTNDGVLPEVQSEEEVY
jgi:hypothetical protein